MHRLGPPDLVQADGDQFGSAFRPVIALKNSVPHIQNSGEIRIEAVLMKGMMAPVHPGSYNNFFQDILNFQWNTKVAVVKLGGKIQTEIKSHQTPEGWPPGQNHETLKDARYNQLPKMKPRSRGHIDLHVAMVGLVKTP